ncbi:type II toxin-antitoxin system VapC family toxin [Curtobacterium sp. VKM Ac-2922]|uniref:type II toxin-antitoxin system VapC family toxin n=1 Tax=Curtobacterium sp. VKM Ac-2922 TaxID=2929475 RepID=UPI001FB1D028|nr:type II toxin-antitoxin system VapC family toxin [Curtobacterium sp. VKM Ac-2922]MCJ1712767.1 type II toxin-antitoxin system VapC family toxin [Curtobacterium sp. VKM Ac-2922]
MIVLDTNVLSELFRPTPDDAVVEWVTTLTGKVAITAITVAELLAGVRRLDDGRRKTALGQAIGGVLDDYDARGAILPFDSVAAEHYADVVVGRLRAGLPISTADAQIAAICRARAATCATRNTKDFAGTGIDLVNPWGAGGAEVDERGR